MPECDVDELIWEDPDGNELVLPHHRPIEGRFAPPVAVDATAVAGQPGEVRRSARHLPREIVIPVHVQDDDSAEVRQTLREWVRKLDTVDGTGTLKSVHEGLTRQIDATYVGGLEIVENHNLVQLASVNLRCHSPYWTDTSDVASDFTFSASSTFFLAEPLTVSGGQIVATPTINNGGDVDAWPVWTVDGPGDRLVLENTTTGDSLTLERTVAAGETVTIDTRPNVKTVTLADGSNLYPDLTADSKLWALQPGDNVLSLHLRNADTGAEITLAFRRRWLTA